MRRRTKVKSHFRKIKGRLKKIKMHFRSLPELTDREIAHYRRKQAEAASISREYKVPVDDVMFYMKKRKHVEDLYNEGLPASIAFTQKERARYNRIATRVPYQASFRSHPVTGDITPKKAKKLLFEATKFSSRPKIKIIPEEVMQELRKDPEFVAKQKKLKKEAGFGSCPKRRKR